MNLQGERAIGRATFDGRDAKNKAILNILQLCVVKTPSLVLENERNPVDHYGAIVGCRQLLGTLLRRDGGETRAGKDGGKEGERWWSPEKLGLYEAQAFAKPRDSLG